jgi:hypothetical protein
MKKSPRPKDTKSQDEPPRPEPGRGSRHPDPGDRSSREKQNGSHPPDMGDWVIGDSH